MGLSDSIKKAACDAAYAVGRGVGRAEQAVRNASEKPEAQDAVRAARAAVSRAADTAGALADRVSPTLRGLADRAVPAIQTAAEKTVSVARETAHKAAPVVKDVAGKTVPVVKEAATAAGGAAVAAACKVGGAAGATAQTAVAAGKAAAAKAAGSVVSSAAKVATENAAGMRDADARPRTVIDPRTGQQVVVEAYVRRPDGSRDYNSVYPQGAKGDFGPVGNKLVGMLLIMAGVPMLVLPGPGAAAIAAGLYFLRKGDGGTPAGVDSTGTPAGPQDPPVSA